MSAHAQRQDSIFAQLVAAIVAKGHVVTVETTNFGDRRALKFEDGITLDITVNTSPKGRWRLKVYDDRYRYESTIAGDDFRYAVLADEVLDEARRKREKQAISRAESNLEAAAQSIAEEVNALLNIAPGSAVRADTDGKGALRFVCKTSPTKDQLTRLLALAVEMGMTAKRTP